MSGDYFQTLTFLTFHSFQMTTGGCQVSDIRSVTAAPNNLET